jgi:hypothetical protein
MNRCAVDGVEVAEARGGRWLHIDELPEDTPEHDVSVVVDGDDYNRAIIQRQSVRLAATEMLRHHGALHPDSTCEWANNLRTALRTDTVG